MFLFLIGGCFEGRQGLDGISPYRVLAGRTLCVLGFGGTVCYVRIMQMKMEDFLLTPEVKFHVPVLSQGEHDAGAVYTGYYIILGITAPDVESAKRAAEDFILDGTVDWSDAEVLDYSPGKQEPIDEAFERNRGFRVWYKSARVTFE